MTPADLRALSEADLTALFSTLPVGPRPQGTYDGKAWSFRSKWFWNASGLGWHGKVFDGDKVTNRILSGQWVMGHLVRNRDEWAIEYQGLGLTDVLRWADGCYLGRMQLKHGAVWFTLVQSTKE